jgi:DNA-binding NtrC family response regulator
MLLARHFLDRLGGGADIQLTRGAEGLIKEYPWPGNVRELENAIERAVILEAGRGVMTAETFSFLKIPSASGMGGAGFRVPADGISLEALEKDLVRQALEISGNNQAAAARLLGLTRAKFRVLMKQTREG